MLGDELLKLKDEVIMSLKKADDLDILSELSSSVFGKNGKLTQSLRAMKDMESEKRQEFGQMVNSVKKELEEKFNLKKNQLAEEKQRKMFEAEAVDVTAPGYCPMPIGRLHPMTKTYREIRDAMIGLGFSMYDGPEIEFDDYCFTKLNLPKDHPARDMQDTFYVNSDIVLRTHTSPCEARALLNLKPPFRLVIPGRVFRVDEVDASHSPVFMQIEGLVVDKDINLANLKGTLVEFIHSVFGEEVKMRMRPSYFPFTEPSAEVDISCTICGGKGCRVCKGTGWLEILGCGVTNPHEIENCGLDPKEWKAFAFGIGVDRVANLKYGVNDIRLQYENDARFLRQF